MVVDSQDKADIGTELSSESQGIGSDDGITDQRVI